MKNAITLCGTNRSEAYVQKFYTAGQKLIFSSSERLNAEDAYNYLDLFGVYVYRGHANAGFLGLHTLNNVTTGYIMAHTDMMNISNAWYVNCFADNSLAQARCVVYLGCKTGTDYINSNGTYNLVDETYKKGAHFVLGATEIMFSSYNDEWLKLFLENIQDGLCIKDAIEQANLSLGSVSVERYDDNGSPYYVSLDAFPCYYAGDTKQYLNY